MHAQSHMKKGIFMYFLDEIREHNFTHSKRVHVFILVTLTIMPGYYLCKFFSKQVSYMKRIFP